MQYAGNHLFAVRQEVFAIERRTQLSAISCQRSVPSRGCPL